MIKEQTAFEEGQATRYTFFMVEVSMKNCPGVTILKVFLEMTYFLIKRICKDLSVNIKGKHDL